MSRWLAVATRAAEAAEQLAARGAPEVRKASLVMRAATASQRGVDVEVVPKAVDTPAC